MTEYVIYSYTSDPSPSLISFVNKTNSAVTIQWTNVPTCYQRVRFTVLLHNPDNSTITFEIDKDSSIYTITDLSPGNTYMIEMYTEYGNNTSFARSLEPVNVTFMTGSILTSCHYNIDLMVQ
jgi:hypothetical protein